MNHKVTLKDVAQAANVSITAVSLVLNNRPTRMSESKRRLIVETAEKLHYIPNQMARGLVTNKSMLLALILPDIENLFFSTLSKAIEDVCSTNGYSLIVANTDDSAATEQKLLTQLEARGIDGLFLIPSLESIESPEKLHSQIDHLSFPVVLVDRLPNKRWCDFIGSDNYLGGSLAATELLDSKHERIACLSAEISSRNMTERKNGFIDELKRNGIDEGNILNIAGGYRLEGGYRAADAIIDWKPTAVFCCNDLMAMGLIRRFNELGIRIPQDCSIIGYDNIVERFGFTPAITTVDQNIKEIANACGTQMLNRITERTGNKAEKTPESAQRILVRPSLIDRSSVACPHQ
jgi:LacI family transcriptional regulator